MPVLAYALECFAAHPDVDAVLPVIHEADRKLFDEVASAFDGAVLEPVNGGEMRQASVRAGLERLKENGPRYVLIHDAARPFADAALVSRVVAALEAHDGAVPAVPVTDTLKRAAGAKVEGTVSRENLWRAQTPQGFRFDGILAAHTAAADADRHDFTDDSSLAEWCGLDVALVEGAECNMKLTTNNDFARAEAWLLAAGGADISEYRTGQGFDVHAFQDGGPLILCGVEVPYEKSLAGHSDADVGLHAITDALLGAIGDGDIGAHFPPSDPKWKDCASDAFLRDAAARVRKRGGSIVNVDLTLICEAPKIGPHRDAMRARISEILELEIARVSVKATTTEGLGFTGRGEGIAAQATATVRIGG
jgi:2-C-methyl-D-erythritol 4-phosphate cytidylyltransferase/2-C-methyl-D-erythritol 2,4-cyclodiphosphate synthase